MGRGTSSRGSKSKSGVDVNPSINSCCCFQGGKALVKSTSHPKWLASYGGNIISLDVDRSGIQKHCS